MIGHQHSIGSTVAILNRQVLNGLSDYGDGIPGSRWQEGSLTGHEHLPSQGGVIPEEGGGFMASGYRVGSRVLYHIPISNRSQAVVFGRHTGPPKQT